MEILKIEAEGASFYARPRGERIALGTVSGAPLPLLPGWTPVLALTGLCPISVLELHHIDGNSSIWFMDEEFRFKTNSFAELPPDLQEALRRELARPARAAWEQLAGSAAPGLDDDTAQIFRSAGQLMRDLAPELLPATGLAETVAVRLDAAEERALMSSVGAGPGAAPIEPAIVTGLFERDYLQDMIAAVETGRVSLPSPATGAMLSTDIAFVLNPSTIAYRFYDPVGKFAFFAIATRWRIMLSALYFPMSGLVICPTDRMLVDLNGFLGGSVGEVMFRHILRHAIDLQEYVRHPSRRISVLYQQEHIGHHLYNELGGISTLLQRIPGERVPEMMLVNAFKSEMFGPVDQIFPELQGKLDRTARDPVNLARHAYATRACLVRPTDDYVSRDLAARIIRVLEGDPGIQEHRQRHRDLVQRGFTTVLFGLRVENRTVIAQAEFFCDVIDVLVERLGRVACVIDGHDAVVTAEGVKPFLSHGEGVAKRSVMDVENEILEAIKDRYGHRDDVDIISAVGATMAATVFWCNRSALFVTPWGAGLAKYRWICNLPGLIAGGERFLREGNHDQIHLYDSREFMQDPAPVVFFLPEDVEDDPSAPQLIDLSDGYRVNYRVRPGAVRKRVLETLAILPEPAQRLT